MTVPMGGDHGDRYGGLISVPDGSLTFLIALPPFQNHKTNQYIFLQLYYCITVCFYYLTIIVMC